MAYGSLRPPGDVAAVTTLAGEQLDGAGISGNELRIPLPQRIRDEIDTIVLVHLPRQQ